MQVSLHLVLIYIPQGTGEKKSPPCKKNLAFMHESAYERQSPGGKRLADSNRIRAQQYRISPGDC